MDKLDELIDFYEMTEDEPELLVMLLELRRHRQDNWKQRAEEAEKAFSENEETKQLLFVQRDTLISANLTIGKALKAAEAHVLSLNQQMGYLEQKGIEERKGRLMAEAEAEDTDKTMRAYSDQLVKVTAELVAAQAQLAGLEKQVYPKAVVRHYTGCKYPVIKINSLEVVIAGEREDAEELAEYVNSMRPAPAVVPVDLLPDEGELERLYSIYCTPTVGSKNAIRHIRKEMLRRIEGMK